MTTKPIYRNKDSWVLCTCNDCGALNYVEPHGTTAHCRKCKRDTEHSNIPYQYRDMSGSKLVRKPESVRVDGKRQFTATIAGHTYHLLDTSSDPSWGDVLAVETHHDAEGTLLSVVNHRERTFNERKLELENAK